MYRHILGGACDLVTLLGAAQLGMDMPDMRTRARQLLKHKSQVVAREFLAVVGGVKEDLGQPIEKGQPTKGSRDWYRGMCDNRQLPVSPMTPAFRARVTNTNNAVIT